MKSAVVPSRRPFPGFTFTVSPSFPICLCPLCLCVSPPPPCPFRPFASRGFCWSSFTSQFVVPSGASSPMILIVAMSAHVLPIPLPLFLPPISRNLSMGAIHCIALLYWRKMPKLAIRPIAGIGHVSIANGISCRFLPFRTCVRAGCSLMRLRQQ